MRTRGRERPAGRPRKKNGGGDSRAPHGGEVVGQGGQLSGTHRDVARHRRCAQPGGRAPAVGLNPNDPPLPRTRGRTGAGTPADLPQIFTLT